MRKRAVFGLGNPGEAYRATRHNVGFWVVEALASALKAPPFASSRYALATHVTHAGIQWHLFLPTTYMNRSGDAVAYWREQLKLELTELLVVVDEIQLSVGAMRLTPKGSSGGHNGLQHIIERLGTTEFARLRIGIGKDFPKGKQVEYVLSPFSSEQEAQVRALLPEAVACVLAWGREGIASAMNRYNRSAIPKAEVGKNPLSPSAPPSEAAE